MQQIAKVLNPRQSSIPQKSHSNYVKIHWDSQSLGTAQCLIGNLNMSVQRFYLWVIYNKVILPHRIILKNQSLNTYLQIIISYHNEYNSNFCFLKWDNLTHWYDPLSNKSSYSCASPYRCFYYNYFTFLELVISIFVIIDHMYFHKIIS